jgi:hypothetical protein
MNDDEQIANGSAVTTGTAAAFQSDSLPIVDAGRNADFDFARPSLDTGSATRRTGISDD